ncbi:hypothetical protein [Chryseobacterium sp.]|jgi:hypothetical protein|uniref:hypothetical protein n=1 Tax=Chryseobacterium sp. TaxID=1871047 RepID=UPI002851E750|nr:hypothetical protein [Chryseobacterium sp.]MDR3026031.1 hypothetical protein [Chryseobacterium sp.]
MKELEELTREIREKLPRLKELSEGQTIKSLIDDPSNDICKDSFYTVGYHEDYSCNIYTKSSVEIGGYVYSVVNDFEIVGKDPMLNDVLDYISKCDNMYRGTNFDACCLNWNLEFPYLKDQSHELIKFLHGLIKK